MTTLAELKQKKIKVDKGCGKAGKISKGIKGQYWYADCGKPYLWERDNGKNIPLNKYLCPTCQATSKVFSLGIEVCENRDKEILDKIHMLSIQAMNNDNLRLGEIDTWVLKQLKAQLKGEENAL